MIYEKMAHRTNTPLIVAPKMENTRKKKEKAKGAHATRGAGGRLPPFPFCSCKVHELFVQPNGNVNYDRGAASKIYTLTQNSRSAMYYLLRDCILEYEPRRK